MWLERLEIQGFRSFGVPSQFIDFSRTLTVIYGDNSQGKTSIAEALEFLLTGTISRRTFTGSTTREFAECLRNAHCAPSSEVSVQGTFVDASGVRLALKRVLISDFTAARECISKLSLDGIEVASPSAILHLSEPPLQTPILLQHSLRYVLSARPQDRATYFKAILDATVLDRVHDLMVAVASESAPVATVLQQRALSLLPLTAFCAADGAVTEHSVRNGIREALRAEVGLPSNLEGAALDDAAHARIVAQSDARFPFPLVEIAATARPEPLGSVERLLQADATIAAAADADASLLRFFEAALAMLPQTPTATIECPLCLEPTLSASRIDEVRHLVADSAELRNAHAVLTIDKQALARWVEANAVLIASATPKVLQPGQEGDREALQQTALSLLLAGESSTQLDAWLTAMDSLADAIGSAQAAVGTAAGWLQATSPGAIASGEMIPALRTLSTAMEALHHRAENYRTSFLPIKSTIAARVAALEALARPRELHALLPTTAELAADLVTFHVREAGVAALRGAADDVRDATKAVLDAKFDALSADIAYWWGLLRPEELNNFAGVQRAGTGRRYLDVKAGLQATAQAAQAVERDAVAVFSDSQLNCLGLAAFLARVTRENSPFLVLDDPIQASDDEHRYTFLRAVPDALLGAGRQVIVLSHDQRLLRDMQDVYAHVSPTYVQVSLESPATGSTLTLLRDSLEIQLTRAHHLSASSSLDERRRASQMLRTEAERLCKRLLVDDRRRAHDDAALLSDYDGLTLDPLIAQATPVLNRDPSHAGKLRVVARALNPGSHDDGVPTGAALRACIGDLRYIAREYL